VSAVADKYEELRKLETEVFSVSVDSHFVHKMWNDHELVKMVEGGVPFHMLSDQAGNIGRAYGVYDETQGIEMRGRFIIDPDGVVQAMEVADPAGGPDASARSVRQVQAFQHVRASGGKPKQRLPDGCRETRSCARARRSSATSGRSGNPTSSPGPRGRVRPGRPMSVVSGRFSVSRRRRAAASRPRGGQEGGGTEDQREHDEPGVPVEAGAQPDADEGAEGARCEGAETPPGRRGTVRARRLVGEDVLPHPPRPLGVVGRDEDEVCLHPGSPRLGPQVGRNPALGQFAAEVRRFGRAEGPPDRRRTDLSVGRVVPDHRAASRVCRGLRSS
jgi:hypothetical protein